MAITWGSTTLSVTEFNRASPESMLEEKELIPDPTADGSVPQTVLLGSGTKRRRINLSIYCDDTDMHSLGDDKQDMTVRTLDLSDIETSLTWYQALISEFTIEKRKGLDDFNFCNIEFLEVNSSS